MGLNIFKMVLSLSLNKNNMENVIDVVAVYGTLKREFGNNRVMKVARGEYIWEDYIQVKALQNVGYPMILLSDDSRKWLKVELFNVPVSGIEWPLDSLEGFYGDWLPNHYNRIKTETLKGRTVWVYEINEDIIDGLEEYYTHNEGPTLFYNWK